MPPNPRSEYSDLMAAIAADPLTFPRRVLGRSYWSGQANQYRTFHRASRVASKGGHGVGKTFAAADYIVEMMATRPGTQVICLGPSHDAVKRNLWDKVRAAFFSSRIRLGGRMGADAWVVSDGWSARCIGADKPEGVQGTHGERVIVVVDEAAGVNAALWSAVESVLVGDGCQLILLFNPTRPNGFARDACADPRFAVCTLSCLDHPNVVSGENVVPGAVTKEAVDAIRARCTAMNDEDYWRGHVLGEFPSADPDALIGLPDLEASLTATAEDVPRLGLDVARFGSDANVLVHIDATRTARIVEEWSGQDLMYTAGRLMRAVRELGVAPSMTFVDSCGVGGGVVDRCKEAGIHVTGVDAGSKATGSWAAVVGRETGFANRRAEMFWALRCICKSVAVRIPREFWADLGMIRVGYRGTDLAIRSKDDMRKEHGRSPDRADALALCFAAPAPSFGVEFW